MHWLQQERMRLPVDRPNRTLMRPGWFATSSSAALVVLHQAFSLATWAEMLRQMHAFPSLAACASSWVPMFRLKQDWHLSLGFAGVVDSARPGNVDIVRGLARSPGFQLLVLLVAGCSTCQLTSRPCTPFGRKAVEVLGEGFCLDLDVNLSLPLNTAAAVLVQK